MAKTDHTASGQGPAVGGAVSVSYYADFSTGTGVGSAQLEVNLGEGWVPAAAAVTADMATAAVLGPGGQADYRWNVTVTSGTITTYLKGAQ